MEQVGEVYIMTSVDQMTDEKTVAVAATSSDKELLLMWRCIRGQTRAAVNLNDSMSQLEFTSSSMLEDPTVQYRFPGNEASPRQSWQTDNEQTLLAGPAESSTFIRNALRSESTLVRVYGGDGTEIMTKRLGLGGLERAFQRLPCR